ncbi:MAG: hypothetical protein P4L51_16655 [Puia sp.]|nr:hypothetical protein [Puia sp.]
MPDLLDLIPFNLATILWLQIQYFFDAIFGEYVVTPTDAPNALNSFTVPESYVMSRYCQGKDLIAIF